MLALYGERAELAAGQDILELGCGWGFADLVDGRAFPRARITAVSNSQSQRAFIEDQCQRRGLANVKVLTCNVENLELSADRFDRCVSVEMFEHVRNHALLMQRIAGWLRPGGKLFLPSSRTASTPIPSKPKGPTTGWAGISSPVA